MPPQPEMQSSGPSAQSSTVTPRAKPKKPKASNSKPDLPKIPKKPKKVKDPEVNKLREEAYQAKLKEFRRHSVN